jgi:hypothetical protein
MHRYLFDMESQDRESNLTDEDELSLWVGRVARAHALLEYNLSNVHRLLVEHDGSGPASTRMPSGVDHLAAECLRLLRRSDVSHEVRSSGGGALSAAKAANGLRNRVVHDMWLPDPLREAWEPPRWNAFRRSRGLVGTYAQPSPRTLETVVEAHSTLVRARLRVSGLFMALHAVWPRSPGRGRRASAASELPRYIALMTGQFTLSANGDFDVTSTG